MLFDFMREYAAQISTIQLLVLFISALINVLFAGAVAKDAGDLTENGLPTILVSGLIWAFATLVGGVYIAAIYWFLHHSKMTRN